MFLKICVFSLALSLAIGSLANARLRLRYRRAAYALPAGVEQQLGIAVKKTFKCQTNGYFADIDNDCKLFHICDTPGHKTAGARTPQQSTMACGIGQRFDQSLLVCNHEDQAIPCAASPDFFYLNERIGDSNAQFLGPADIDKAKNARPEYRARAKAKARAKAR